MPTQSKCRAVTRSGSRCTRKAVTAGFCSAHFPKPEKTTLLERAKTVGQVVTTAAGVITLIQKSVELWQSLPFGPGSEMTNSYDYLVGEFGPSWGEMPSTYSPANYGAKSVNWTQAVELYEFAKRNTEREPSELDHQKQTEEILSVLAEQFIDGLPPEFGRMLFKSIGQESDSDA